MQAAVRMKYLTQADLRSINGFAHTIKDRVDEALAIKGMTQKQFGLRAGITNVSYASSWWSGMRKQISTGRFNPSMGMVCRFAKALKVKPEDLLEEFK